VKSQLKYSSKKIGVVITCAGTGSRYDSKELKQLVLVNGMSILEHTCRCFLPFEKFISEIVLTVPSSKKSEIKKHVEDVEFPFKVNVVVGGVSRAESVKIGFEELGSVDIVLIHDGVRPNVSKSLIERLLDSLETNDAVVPAIKVSDTLKTINKGIISGSVDRDNVMAIQTPQGFKYSLIKKAYRSSFSDQATDESSLVQKLGEPVHTILGEANNIKITTKFDLSLFKLFLESF
jgi:2-C-methyl-D-erythritol 4-phosphate cytidylyltransferase